MSDNREKISFGPEHEHSDAIEKAGEQQREHLREQHEKAGEQSHEKDIEGARHEALEHATKIDHEREQQDKAEKKLSPAERRKDGPIGKSDRDASFNTTMHEVQNQMSAPSRAFSKVIHNKAVEKVSDVAGSTIARPNAMLSGAVFAFVLTLAVYLVAKNYGFVLTGFETIGAFVIGWVIGIVYDFLKVMITGRK
jgi:hypothetical protein